MHSRIASLRKGARSAPGTHECPLEIVGAHTGPAATAQAPEAAIELARGSMWLKTLMAVHAQPNPLALECQEGIRQRLEAEVSVTARTTDASVRVKLVFARDWDNAGLGLVERGQTVVIRARDRLWRAREQCLASCRRTRRGLVKVNARMLDLFFVILAILFFLVPLAFVCGCDHL